MTEIALRTAVSTPQWGLVDVPLTAMPRIGIESGDGEAEGFGGYFGLGGGERGERR